MSTTPHPYQSINHDASISAARDDDDPDKIIVEIVIGELAESRITMWADDFAQMASLGGDPLVQAAQQLAQVSALTASEAGEALAGMLAILAKQEDE